jgi:hypothetical protein
MTFKNQLLASSVEDLEKRYNFSPKKKYGMIMDKSKIPEQYWVLIPYIEFFYSKDQKERESLKKKMPKQAILDFKEILKMYDAPLDEWLAGEEAFRDVVSDEYTAFSLLRMYY